MPQCLLVPNRETLTQRNIELVNLRSIRDIRGNLTPVESLIDVPFSIARVYFLYDVPSGSSRGGHAHKSLVQLLIPLAGSFDVLVADRHEETTIRLDRPNIGLMIGNYVWREMHNFSAGSVCLVLASQPYDESDYIRDRREL